MTSPPLTPEEQLWQCLWGALSDLGWLTDARAAAPRLPTNCGDACWLRGLLSDEPRSLLSPRGVSALEALVDDGVSLRRRWRAWHDSVERWLGVRLYLGHAGGLSSAMRWVSIVSSRMGRHGSRLPDWPQFIDSALQTSLKRKHRLLVAPRSATSQILSDCAPPANLPVCQLRLADNADISVASQHLRRWLAEELGGSSIAEHSWNCIAISPAVRAADVSLEPLPLQDRAAIALANAIYVLSIRPGGSMEKLVETRLADERFPTGSVFVATRSPSHTQRSARGRAWLEQGAVGWHVGRSSLLSQSEQLVAGCRVRCSHKLASGMATQQLCSPLPQSWPTIDDNDWNWLAHCTRGQCGPLPGETASSYRQRAWVGGTPAQEPMWNLLRILEEGWLRGNASLTRSGHRCVSFSAVPLPCLLQRRSFRSHLGRWDWEPYGLLMRRTALAQIGARPVVYGTQGDFERLDAQQQAYFQPLGKAQQGDQAGWEVEREWRLLGDLKLSRLPGESVMIFARTRNEALAIARRHAWSVVWTHRPDA